jgi:hypothetical protein
LSNIAHHGSTNESIKNHAASYHHTTSACFLFKETTKKKKRTLVKKQINITITNYNTHHAAVTTCIVPPSL